MKIKNMKKNSGFFLGSYEESQKSLTPFFLRHLSPRIELKYPNPTFDENVGKYAIVQNLLNI